MSTRLKGEFVKAPRKTRLTSAAFGFQVNDQKPVIRKRSSHAKYETTVGALEFEKAKG